MHVAYSTGTFLYVLSYGTDSVAGAAAGASVLAPYSVLTGGVK
jgi:hypothetical protein